MLIGAHAIICSTSPDADRAFLRDVLKLPSVDVSDGWLIFGLPPAEVAVHVSSKNDVHEFNLMCDDVEALVAEMKRHSIACSPVQNQGWGLLTQVRLPGGGKLGIYQPRQCAAEGDGRGAPPAGRRQAFEELKRTVGTAPAVILRAKQPALERVTAGGILKSTFAATPRVCERRGQRVRRRSRSGDLRGRSTRRSARCGPVLSVGANRVIAGSSLGRAGALGSSAPDGSGFPVWNVRRSPPGRERLGAADWTCVPLGTIGPAGKESNASLPGGRGRGAGPKDL